MWKGDRELGYIFVKVIRRGNWEEGGLGRQDT
jgi:hypothetical protein